jgi:hypothetical protein
VAAQHAELDRLGLRHELAPGADELRRSLVVGADLEEQRDAAEPLPEAPQLPVARFLGEVLEPASLFAEAGEQSIEIRGRRSVTLGRRCSSRGSNG